MALHFLQFIPANAYLKVKHNLHLLPKVTNAIQPAIQPAIQSAIQSIAVG